MIGQKHTLSFAKLTVIRDDIAELIVDHGVEVNLAMVDEYHTLLRSLFNAPFSILVNKHNPYSYTFEAQEKIPALDEIYATAVVVYSSMAEVGTTVLAKGSATDKKWNMKIFSDRNEALSWLIIEQEKAKK